MSREIHGARLKLTLCTLSDETNVPAATKGEEIGSITSVTGSFPMNDIPEMEVEIPLGRKFDGPNTLTKSYAYGDTLKKALTNRQALGVYITVEKVGDASLIGLEEGEHCLFKGYATNAAEENGINGGTMKLSLTHWLCDLSIFPILHKMSSPENPADVSCESVFYERYEMQAGGGQSSNMTGSAWTPAGAFSDALEKGEKNILEAIKIGFSTALEEGKELKPEEAGYINRDLFQKVSNALKAIDGEKLTFSNDLKTDSQVFRFGIANALSKENRDAYFSVTLWQKLIQTMLPQFYASLIPLVDKGLVIPQPGIHMDSLSAHTIDPNIMMSLRTRTSLGKTLGGVVLSGRAISNSGPFGTAVSKVKNYKYPEEQKPGVMKVCYMPTWLEAYLQLIHVRPEAILRDGFASDNASDKAESDAKKLDEKIQQYNDSFTQFAKAFTRSVYFAEATKGNAATLTTVLNLQICPGMVVEIPVPSDVTMNDTHYCYGTVHTVQYTIGPETATSTFVMSNVRTEDQMAAMLTNDAILYESGWYGQQNLYV